MLNPVKSWRHVVVGAAVALTPGLVALGWVGGGIHDERFEAKQVVVRPIDEDGLRITEVVDDDFGTVERHGYQRFIPHDFGVPQDIEVKTSRATDDLEVVNLGSETRIRIGDANITLTGQHRYVLSYTLPNARISTNQLALDIIGNDETLETLRFEIVVTGFELVDPLCNVGDFGDVGGCELIRDGEVYRAVIAPLKPGQGITIGGTITDITEPVDVAAPPLPERREDNSMAWALGLLGLGVITAGGTFLFARRAGRNEVGGSTAADAAFAGGSTRLVTDADLADLATTEFEAPRGIRPWQGTMLLTEQVSSETVSAWFSDLIAQEWVTLTGDKPQVLRRGPKAKDAPVQIRDDIERLFGDADELTLGKYQPKLGTLWNRVLKAQTKEASKSGWWSKFPPGTIAHFPKLFGLVTLVALGVLAVCIWQSWLRAWPAPIAGAIAIPAIFSSASYRRLLPVRSAAGSAYALRAESFRRFLQASEGKHVDWAWRNGLLREYSAWAVALGAADAWGRAIANSSVPPQDIALHTMPMVVHTHRGEFTQAHTKPTPRSSSSGGGSFSGGSVGGGGGGGSSSNW